MIGAMAPMGVKSMQQTLPSKPGRELKMFSNDAFEKSNPIATDKISSGSDKVDPREPDRDDAFDDQFKKALNRKGNGSDSESPDKTRLEKPLKQSETRDLKNRAGVYDRPPQTAAINKNIERLDRKDFFVEANGPLNQKLSDESVQQFVDSMESELGVDSQQLIGAFKKLNPELLVKRPEETMPQVLDNLKLDDQDYGRAQELFVNMVGDLSKRPAPAKFETLAPADTKKLELLTTLEKLSKTFFLNDRRIPYSSQEFQEGQSIGKSANVLSDSANGPELNGNAGVVSSELGAEDGDDASDVGLSSMASAGIPIDGMDEMDEPFNAPLAKQSIPLKTQSAGKGFEEARVEPDVFGSGKSVNSQAQSRSQSLSGGKSIAKDLESVELDGLNVESPKAKGPGFAKNLEALLKDVEAAVSNDPSLKEASFDANAAPSLTIPTASSMPEWNSSGKSSEDEKESGSEKSTSKQNKEISDVSKPNFAVGSDSNKPLIKATTAAAAAPLNSNSSNEIRSANFRQIVDQASGMSKKGGGEMVVKLNPDGLGELNLKVAVKDGRVHVEMLTDNADAKKMLESGLGDLKKSLELHKIHVEAIRVDASDSGRMSSNQDSMNSSAGRDMAREFLGNFREQNDQTRQGFFETPAMRAYRMPTKKAAEIPPDSVISSNRPDSSRRLNLVA